MGQGKRYEPNDHDRKMVQTMASVGIAVDHMADALNVSKPTLYKYYSELIKTSAVKANANVAGALYKSAMRGSVAAQIFWCKTRLRWREHDRPGDNDGTLQEATPKVLDPAAVEDPYAEH